MGLLDDSPYNYNEVIFISTENELLKYALDNGIIDLSNVQAMIEMRKRKELLKHHPYDIYQEKTGKYCTYLPDSKKGRILIRRKTKKEVEDIVIDYWEEQINSPTLESVFIEWLERKIGYNEISKATYDKYSNDFKRFYGDDRGFALKRIKDIDEDDIEDFLKESIVKHNLSAKGFANLRLITSGMFKHAKKKKYISWSISELINDMDISRKAFKKIIKEDYEEVFSDDEKDKIMGYMEKHPDIYNLGIILIFETGLRVGELVGLKWEDFDGISLKIRRTETKYKDEAIGKTVYKMKEFPKTEAGVRSVVIPEDYLWVMKKLKTINPFTEFIFEKNGEVIKTYIIRDKLQKLCKNLGIYEKSPHKIRKTYGSILLDNNIDKNLILNQMGHADILTTETKYHRNRKTVAKQASIISNIPELKQTNKAIM